jgi:hypothetical protein
MFYVINLQILDVLDVLDGFKATPSFLPPLSGAKPHPAIQEKCWWSQGSEKMKTQPRFPLAALEGFYLNIGLAHSWMIYPWKILLKWSKMDDFDWFWGYPYIRKAPKNKHLRSFEGTLGPFAEADLPSCTAWVRGPLGPPWCLGFSLGISWDSNGTLWLFNIAMENHHF